MSLRSEIFEQPSVLARLLETQLEVVQEIAASVRSQEINFIFLAARGTSDNAGRYGKYLWGSHNQLPVALAAPSLFGIYRMPPALKNCLVVGVSQSGESPDIVGVLAEGKRQGALTLAITNEPASPLAKQADFVIDICAGEEKAVAATKTYTTQLMAVAMLSAALGGDKAQFEVLKQAPAQMAEALALDSTIEQAAQRYRYMKQCVVVGRGYNYATAFEWSLKLKELTYVVAEPYSSADFRHGPIAVVERGFPVMVVAPQGAVYSDMVDLIQRLKNRHQAELLVISNEDEALSLASTPLRLPADLPEWTSPLVCIVPAQLFSYHLTRVKGWDTESPRGLTKVTHTN